MIGWLQAEVVEAVGGLLKAVARGSQDAVIEAVAGVIIAAYLLGRRLGFSYTRVDLRLQDKLRAGISAGHEAEQSFNDLQPYCVT